jgi:hypothetical protein
MPDRLGHWRALSGPWAEGKAFRRLNPEGVNADRHVSSRYPKAREPLGRRARCCEWRIMGPESAEWILGLARYSDKIQLQLPRVLQLFYPSGSGARRRVTRQVRWARSVGQRVPKRDFAVPQQLRTPTMRFRASVAGIQMDLAVEESTTSHGCRRQRNPEHAVTTLHLGERTTSRALQHHGLSIVAGNDVSS